MRARARARVHVCVRARLYSVYDWGRAGTRTKLGPTRRCVCVCARARACVRVRVRVLCV